MITTEDIVRATNGILLNGDMGIFFTGISIDSRSIKPGELFVALKGERFDGHDFVLEAFKAGARGAIVSRWPENIDIFELHRAFSLIQVRDTLQALGDLATYVRRRFPGPVVGITGSCGKTTTKELLAEILSSRYQVAKSPGNWNNLIGVPLTILNVPEGANIMVLELATSQPGEIKRLTEISSPKVAVLVSVHPSHLDGLGDLEGVMREKLAIFEKSPPGAIFVYPYDQPEVRKRVQLLGKDHRLISFGFEKGADLWARDLSFELDGSSFKLVYCGKELGVFLPLIGRHFVVDAIAAAAAALAMGFELSEIVDALARAKTLAKRLEIRRLGRHLIFDDTYNANPGSLAAACEVVNEIAGNFFKRLAVIGDMKELGDSTKQLHQEAGRQLAKVFDYILAIGDHACEIVSGAGRDKAEAFSGKEVLIERLISLIDQPSLILVKGSRAMKMEEIVKLLEERL